MSKLDNNIGNIRTKKALIRKEMLGLRHAMTKEDCKTRSEAICAAFLESEEYKSADTILLYKAYNNEVDTDMIFAKALSDGKKVAYPCSCIVDGEPDLTFYVITDDSQFKEGFRGIPEPDINKVSDVFEGSADICITPGVAFDKKCHRIGYGMAFYDRYIRLNSPRCVIALAYETQITDVFETSARDRAVDKVITDKAVYTA